MLYGFLTEHIISILKTGIIKKVSNQNDYFYSIVCSNLVTNVNDYIIWIIFQTKKWI